MSTVNRSHVSLSHLILVRRERTENLLLLPLGHVEEVQSASELGRDLIELRRRDPEVAMRFLQAEGGAPPAVSQ
jgi:hypothetical protein